jgi:hypothetical protein
MDTGEHKKDCLSLSGGAAFWRFLLWEKLSAQIGNPDAIPTHSLSKFVGPYPRCAG